MLFPLLFRSEWEGSLEPKEKKMVGDTCRLRYYYYVAVAIALAIAIFIVAYFWDFGHESLKSGKNICNAAAAADTMKPEIP